MIVSGNNNYLKNIKISKKESSFLFCLFLAGNFPSFTGTLSLTNSLGAIEVPLSSLYRGEDNYKEGKFKIK
jgi:hypothetical protein